MGDITVHGGVIVMGMLTVLIGDAGSANVGAIGQSMVSSLIAAEGQGVAFAQMKKALIAAAKDGLPFCEQCMAAAGG